MELTEASGLLGYGVNFVEQFRRAAYFIDGAKSGDLPIEQPTKFKLAINLKTARAIRLRIPQSILLRADRVIE